MKTKTVYEDIGITSGDLWRSIWNLSWPMLLMMVFFFVVGLTDVYVAGLINADIQAAIGFISQLYFLFVIVGNAISIGTVSLFSRAIGSDDFHRALWIARHSIISGTVLALFSSVILFLFSGSVIRFVGLPAHIHAVATVFLRIFACSLLPHYLLIISNAVFRASGEVKKPLVTMGIVSAVNIAGDFGFVFGFFPFPRLGYAGIAVATALSATIGVAINAGFLTRRWWRDIYTAPWSFSFRTVKNLTWVSWPSAVLQVAWNAGSIVLYGILARLGDESITALASLTSGLRIEAIIYLPPFAFNMAASVLIGQNLGAGKIRRAEETAWKIGCAAMMFVAGMAVIIFIGAEFFASLVAANSDVIQETARYLRINMIAEPFMALGIVMGGSLQGAGDTRGTMWVIIRAMWLIRLPLAYYLVVVAGLGATGAWVAMTLSMTVQGLLMARRFQQGVWKTLRFDDSDMPDKKYYG